MFRVKHRIGEREGRWILCAIAAMLIYDRLDDLFYYAISGAMVLFSVDITKQREVIQLVQNMEFVLLWPIIFVLAYFLYRGSVTCEHNWVLRSYYKDFIEIMWEGVPKRMIEACESMRGEGMAIQHMMMEHVGKGTVDSGCGEALMNVYHKLSRPKDGATLQAMQKVIRMQSDPVGGLARRGREKATFSRKQMDQLKVALTYLPQKQIDGVWDRMMRTAVKREEKRRAYEERIDAIWNGVPKQIVAACEEERGNGFVVERMLTVELEAGRIDEEYAKELMTLYHRLKMPEKKTTLEAMRRVIRAEGSGAEAGRRRRIICGFDKEKLNEFKRMIFFMPQENIDRHWDEYMLSAAKAAEESGKN